MKRNLRIYFCLLAILCALTTNASKTKFTLKKVEIKVYDTINIDGIAKWYLNFDKLKNTVIYSDKLISVGLNGGFVCINPRNMEVDSIFSKKLNSDFFTNLVYRQDTLISEKFGELYYLNRDTIWTKYSFKLPVKLFDILYEDNQYILYPCDFGEWGSSLYIYDKYSQSTKGLSVSDCPRSVIKQNGKFLISAATYHGSGSSELYYLNDLECLKTLVKGDNKVTTDSLKKYWKNQIGLDFTYSSKFIQKLKEIEYGSIATIFQQDSTFYSIEQDLHRDKSATITKMNNNILLDYENTHLDDLETAHQYGRETIIKCFSQNRRYLYISADTIYSITYSTPKSFTFDEFSSYSKNYRFRLNGDTINKEQITFCYISSEYNNRHLESKINNETKITFSSHGWDFNKADLFITQNGTKYNLKFKSETNFLSFCFNYSGNTALYFKNTTGKQHKYGLIEILGLERFISGYCE